LRLGFSYQGSDKIKNLSIFAYGLDEFTRVLSKKGTESDITLSNRKDDNGIFTFLTPSRFPEKVSSLTDSIYPSDIAILNGDNISKDLGEVIVALDLMKKTSGYFITGDSKNIDILRNITKNTSLSNYKFFSGNPMEFLSEINAVEHKPMFSNTTVMIDHFFKVKSVGVVALGFVLGGKVEKHQELNLSYIDKKVQIKSIQMHDEDVESADSGSRVGLALKGLEVEELERGMVLSDHEFNYVKEFDGKFEPHPSLKQPVDDEFEFFVSDEMRYQRGMLDKGKVSIQTKFLKLNDSFVVSIHQRTPRICGRMKVS
jgi:selenocysteine-specific translation elongation factor